MFTTVGYKTELAIEFERELYRNHAFFVIPAKINGDNLIGQGVILETFQIVPLKNGLVSPCCEEKKERKREIIESYLDKPVLYRYWYTGKYWKNSNEVDIYILFYEIVGNMFFERLFFFFKDCTVFAYI